MREQAASVTEGLGFINVMKQRRCVGEECVSKVLWYSHTCMHLQRPSFMQVLHGPYDMLVQNGYARAVLLLGACE